MNEQQLHTLSLRETDISGAINRCCGDESLYVACLKEFLEDTTVEQLNKAIKDQQWDDAFTAAHALKGVAGNMGFVPLMLAVGQLIVVIRRGKIGEIATAMEEVDSSYRDIKDAIKKFFTF